MRYHWRSPRTCATAHTSRYKHHFGLIVKRGIYLVKTFVGQRGPTFGVAPRPESRSELQVVRHNIVVERLLVGISHKIAHLGYVVAIHLAHGITAAAPHTNHLDNARCGHIRYLYQFIFHFHIFLACLTSMGATRL